MPRPKRRVGRVHTHGRRLRDSETVPTGFSGGSADDALELAVRALQHDGALAESSCGLVPTSGSAGRRYPTAGGRPGPHKLVLYLEMMFVFVTEWWVLDAVEADGANEGHALWQRCPTHAATTATPHGVLCPPAQHRPCCLSSMPSPLPWDDVLTAEPPALVWLAPAPREGLWGVPAGGAGGY